MFESLVEYELSVGVKFVVFDGLWVFDGVVEIWYGVFEVFRI